MKPNLFRYGPSELSQDAFFCWLIAHASEPTPGALSACARAFVAFLYRQSTKLEVAADDVTEVTEPRRQKFDTDILFYARLAGQEKTFVIEDKVDTTEHSDQLARYEAALRASGELRGELVRIYLKTGFMFPEDHAVTRFGYAPIGPDELLEFLAAFDVPSDIYAEFSAHLEARVAAMKAGHAQLFEADDPDALASDYVQWTFLETLSASCPDCHGAPGYYRSRSPGGVPFASYTFIRLPGVPAETLEECVFYRVDRRQGGYCLAVRQYVWNVRENEAARREKVRRLAWYRTTFEEAANQAGGGLQFGEPVTDNTGKNESDIAVLYFQVDPNRPRSVLAAWPELHRAFLERLRACDFQPAPSDATLATPSPSMS